MSTEKAKAKQIQVEANVATTAGTLQELIETRKIIPTATVTADGAMSKGDKAKLEDLPSNSELGTALSGKVDKVTGKALSTNDYSNADKAKLVSLEGSHFRGVYVNEGALAGIASPVAGDYADVDAGIEADAERWIYDASDSKWVVQESSAWVTASQVKQLYESNADTNAFTDTEKTKLADVASEATKNRDDSENADKVHTHSTAQVTGLDTALGNKVDKVSGKGLSDENYTLVEMGKLSALPTNQTLGELLDDKVDKEAGKGLSTNDYSNADKAKLTSLEGSHWRGTYISAAALDDILDPIAGDYADVDTGVGQDAERWIYDANDNKWVVQSSATGLTAAQVKLMYESNPDTNNFDDAHKTIVDTSMREGVANPSSWTTLAQNAIFPTYHQIDAKYLPSDAPAGAYAYGILTCTPSLTTTTDSRYVRLTYTPHSASSAGKAVYTKTWSSDTDSGGWIKLGEDSSLKTNIKVTVGTGGNFPTIKAAILYLSRLTPDLGVTAEVELISGFVMSEQLFVKGLNLGWITITGVDAETVINEPSLTSVLVDNHKPAFGVTMGTLPNIGQLFSFSSQGSTSDRRSGVIAYNSGRATILNECGVKNAGYNGIAAYNASTINAALADVSYAGSVGIGAYQGSTINAQGVNASVAGEYGIVAYSGSTINAEGASLLSSPKNGIAAYSGSTINAEGADADSGTSGPGFYGISVFGGSTINAVSVDGTLSQTGNTIVANGIIFV